MCDAVARAPGGRHLRRARRGIEIATPAAGGPPQHRHDDADETVYVLEGELRWKLDGAFATTGPGGYAFIPRGVPHTWHAVTDGRMLITFAPAGMEGFFDALATMEAFDLDAFTRAATEHRMEVLGPPLRTSDPAEVASADARPGGAPPPSGRAMN